VGSERNPDRVLIVHDPVSAALLANPIAIPGAEVIEAHSCDGLKQAIAQRDFDVVVIDYDLPGTQDVGLLAELKVREHEPEVLLLSKCEDAQTIQKISQSQKRYVVRDEMWLESVRRGVRDLLRIRRLEHENTHIRAKLTESNRSLEERNDRLDEFCATIAHDIRGPLAGLIVKIDYILERFGGTLDEKAAAMLTRSMESAQRLSGVVQAMYEFAKLGREGATFTNVELTPMVREIVADLRSKADRAVTLQVAQLPSVLGDRELLRRVFLNLIGNSLKYGDAEWVIVAVTAGGVITRGGESLLQVLVRDNGPGIESSDAAHLFGMFSRGSSAANSADGLGVGLAVARRILELHGGSIELVTDGQPGCCFRVTLPLA
jgi:signal transduction histidine kinase